ncbi:MAG TPA: hypothetical protein VIU12_12980 [Chryseolinea sp.]
MKKFYALAVITLSVVLFNCGDSDDTPPPDKKGSWKRLNDFPGEARNGSISFVINGKGYIGMGVTDADPFPNDFWEYDPSKDSWTQKKDFPYGGPAVAAVTINNKGYMMIYSSAVFEYDAQADSWEYKSSLSTDVRPNIAAFAVGGKGYFGTGSSLDAENHNVIKNDLWMFDPVNNSWTPRADFPGAARIATIAMNIGEKGYMGVGFSGQGAPPYLTDFYEYDPARDTWTQKKDFPNAQAAPAYLFSNSTTGYVGAAVNSGAALFKYDPGADEWTTDTVFPSPNYMYPATFTIGSRIFMVGGFFTVKSKEVWEFIP